MSPGARKAEQNKGAKGFVPQRSSRHRNTKIRILIVGEGQQTEPNYFRKLRDEPVVKARFAITVKGGHGFSQDLVVEEAIEHKRKAERRSEAYDEVWCVIDVEGPSKAESLARACDLARTNGITLWLSNPSFEVWFLLHFVKQARPYNDGDAVIAELQKPWQAQFKREYEKNDESVYDRLRQFMSVAVENAQWVLEKHHQSTTCIGYNSSTELYKLVLRLMPVAVG